MLYDPKWNESEVILTLKAARALIEKPKNWAAEDARGEDGRYCMFRAIEAAGGISRSFKAIEEAIGTNSIGWWNDTHLHAEVLVAFDRAIEAELAKP